jgi:hypothetical protein
VPRAPQEVPRPAPETDDLDRLLRAFGLIILLTRDPEGLGPEGAAAARLRSLKAQTSKVSTLIAPPFPPEGDRRHIAAWTLGTLAALKAKISILPDAPTAPAVKCGEMRVASCDSAPAAAPETGPEAALSNLNPAPDPLIQTEQIQSDANKTLNRLGISSASSFIAIHPGGGGRPKWPPSAALAALARGFCKKTGARPLLIEGPADEAPTALFKAAWGAIAHTSGAEEIPRLVSPPLDLLSALLARSAAFVGGDSGVSHLAALSGAPTLALLGPASNPVRWGPIGPRAGWISWNKADEGADSLMRLAGREP